MFARHKAVDSQSTEVSHIIVEVPTATTTPVLEGLEHSTFPALNQESSKDMSFRTTLIEMKQTKYTKVLGKLWEIEFNLISNGRIGIL